MDTEYILAGAAEHAEITPLEYLVLAYDPAAYAAVRHVVDNNARYQGDFLANTAHAALSNMPMPLQHCYSLLSAKNIAEALTNLQFVLVSQLARKVATDLGYQAESAFVGLSQSLDQNKHGEPCFETVEAVTEARVLDVLTRNSQAMKDRWLAEAQRLHHAMAWWLAGPPEATEAKRSLLQQAMRGEALDPDNRRQQALLHSLDCTPTQVQAARAALRRLQTLSESAPRLTPHLPAQAAKKVKAALKRCARLWDRLGKADTLSLFLSGAKVEISRPEGDFKFVVQATEKCHTDNWLTRGTLNAHYAAPFTIEAYTRDNIYLAKLCVYLRETPILDQLLALSLYVDAGEEVQVLQAANWFSFGGHPEYARQALLDRGYSQLAARLPAKQQSHEESALGLVSFAALRDPLQTRAPDLYDQVQCWVRNWLAPVTEPLLLALREARGQVSLLPFVS